MPSYYIISTRSSEQDNSSLKYWIIQHNREKYNNDFSNNELQSKTTKLNAGSMDFILFVHRGGVVWGGRMLECLALVCREKLVLQTQEVKNRHQKLYKLIRVKKISKKKLICPMNWPITTSFVCWRAFIFLALELLHMHHFDWIHKNIWSVGIKKCLFQSTI